VTPASQHIDLMPTILDSLDLAIPPAVQGRSLLGEPVPVEEIPLTEELEEELKAIDYLR
jgi:arylsulfatase A-like enzyme